MKIRNQYPPLLVLTLTTPSASIAWPSGKSLTKHRQQIGFYSIHCNLFSSIALNNIIELQAAPHKEDLALSSKIFNLFNKIFMYAL